MKNLKLTIGKSSNPTQEHESVSAFLSKEMRRDAMATSVMYSAAIADGSFEYELLRNSDKKVIAKVYLRTAF